MHIRRFTDSWRSPRTAAACLLTLVLTLTLALSAHPTYALATAAPMGVFAGSGNPAAAASFENEVGGPVSYVHDFLPGTSWQSLSDPTWTVGQWAATRYAQGKVVYSIPMLPSTGGVSLAAGATGAYNGHFRTLAQRFVDLGEGNVILRIGWELNGSWFPWSIGVPNGGADYAAYWRQIVTTMRSVPGANFTFDWTVNADSSWVDGSQLDATTAWPGAAYVDYVGCDLYDQSWVPNHTDPVARWNGYLTAKHGLNWHATFAAQQGKPMTYPEWGLAFRLDGHGGGDAPYFVSRMHDWVTTHDVAHHMYFQSGGSGLDHRLFTGNTPFSDAEFRDLFGFSTTH